MKKGNSFKITSMLFSLLFLAGTAGMAGAMEFIAIGDTPYSPKEDKRIKAEIAPAIRKYNPPLLVHHGDLFAGDEACSEDLFRERLDQARGLLPGRVFYTPGDNEWTDCDRTKKTGQSLSELSMLGYIRRYIVEKPVNLPKDWNYEIQPNFPENARWIKDGVIFITVHLVSTNNGRMEILKDDMEAALSLVDARDHANRTWINESFEAASKMDAKAAVIVTQADVTSPDGGGPCTNANRSQCDAFLTFRENLKIAAGGFKGGWDKPLKPVLFLHGDTNPFCMDREFGGKTAPNLWRLNAWGDFKAPVDATVVTVSPENGNDPFSARTLIGNVSPDAGCD